MNLRRDYRNRASHFDSIEEGGILAPSYSSHEIDEYGNDRAIDGLQDRVNILKRLTGEIHEEVEIHNRALDRMGHDMDASRGVLSGTVDLSRWFLRESQVAEWLPLWHLSWCSSYSSITSPSRNLHDICNDHTLTVLEPSVASSKVD